MALLEVSARLKRLLLCSIISFSLTMAAACFGQDTQGKSQTPPGPVGASGQSAYPLDKPHVTVLEALSMAGGLLPQAGNTVTVVHKAHQQADSSNVGAGQKTPSEDRTLTIDLAKATAGKDRTLNVEVHPGDMLTVSTAPPAFVVGAVNKAGGFA